MVTPQFQCGWREAVAESPRASRPLQSSFDEKFELEPSPDGCKQTLMIKEVTAEPMRTPAQVAPPVQLDFTSSANQQETQVEVAPQKIKKETQDAQAQGVQGHTTGHTN